MPAPAMPLIDEDIIRSALLLALMASVVRRAWHAGVMDAETAMSRLDGFLSAIAVDRA